MYPNLYYAFKDLFGVEINGLKIVNSFGFFVAIAFMTGAWVLTNELKRKQKLGLLSYTEQVITVGAPASITEILVNLLLGFLLGFKIIGAFMIPGALDDPQGFLLSGAGNWPLGILIGLFFAGWKWWEKNKEKLAKPEQRTIRIWPHDRVGDLVIYAAIFGFAGAKLFDILESPSSFMRAFNEYRAGRSDMASFIFSGLTFYGGLILATVAIVFYARKHKIGIIHLADAMGPTMMIAYAVGRVGCQVSGDGDWGIVNTKPNPFSWLPNWMWGYQYPHNVVNDGVPIAGCEGSFCNQLPHPVFPTPFYEIVMCSLFFLALIALRKKLKLPGQIAGLYLIFNGVERFFIEKIRVNATYDIMGFHPTQAEIISTLLVIAGIILFWFASKGKFVQAKAIS